MGAKLPAQAQQVRKKTEGEGGCAECRERCDSAYGHWPTRTRPVTGAPFVAVGDLAHRGTSYAPGLFERGCQVVATSHLSLAWRAEPAGISVSVVTSLLTTVGLVALLYAHARTVRKTSFVVMTGFDRFCVTRPAVAPRLCGAQRRVFGVASLCQNLPSGKSPPKTSPLKGGAGNFGPGIPRKQGKRGISGRQACHIHPSLQPSTPRATSPVIASLARSALRSGATSSADAAKVMAASSSTHLASAGAPGLPVIPSLNMARSAVSTIF